MTYDDKDDTGVISRNFYFIRNNGLTLQVALLLWVEFRNYSSTAVTLKFGHG